MSFKKISSCFFVGLPVCVAARIFQIVYATEYASGFFIRGREVWGTAMLVLIAAVCVALAILSFKAYKKPEKAPETTALLSVPSFFAVIGLMYEVFAENMPQTMAAWQVLAVKLVTVLCAVYFVAFAIQSFTEFKMPALFHVAPCVYAIVKTIFTFINISSIAVISDNILLVAGYCLLMLFFINFGKLYNGVDKEKGFRKVLATGLAASTVCITQSLSVVVVNVFSKKEYLHADTGVMWSLLAIGIFIAIFILRYFKTAENED